MPFAESVRRAAVPAAAAATVALLVPVAPVHAAATSASPSASVTAPASTSVSATVETAPVSHSGDAADDPAIWVHPTDPARSVVVGTDKKGALEVYDMTGARIQRISGDHGNNVDLRGNIVVTADDEAAGGSGAMHVYRIDPATRRLTRLKDVPTEVTAHGICLYTSPVSGKLYAFPNSTSGRVEQWELAVSGNSVTATSVRLWDAGSAVEGCYADDATGKLYLGEEDVGVWIYGAEPTAGARRTALDSTGSGGRITADTEGITAAGNRIYVSSQGSDDFTVHDRTTHAYLGRFSVAGGTAADDCEDTDGIDATAADLGPAFPQGVFVCQDGSNGTPGGSGNQNFKLVPLQRITAHFS
ncbi:phytase [Streptomyces bambusae]|uniref:Phytase n=1 Tax=Streptomyces bambusae TaxID=1550616 RepID=A0ABS6ZF54_9ACTN|nr:phytase [Streptomyces bambusae]MBW5486226.1 phytase [Streptomyces bambusae]